MARKRAGRPGGVPAKENKLEMSQKVTLFTAYFCMGIVVVMLSMNFLLLWYDKQAMTQEFMAVVATYGAITSTLTFGGYVALNAIRHTSLNKVQRSRIERTGTVSTLYLGETEKEIAEERDA